MATPVTLPMGRRANSGPFRAFVLTALVAVAVTAFSFVSPAKIGDVQLGRLNLYPELLEYDDDNISDSEFAPDFESLYSQVAETPVDDASVEQTFLWNADSSAVSGEGYRIAFLGDSFIEGDILTADLRERLQSTFGGAGVGFVPCELPFAVYRHTAKVRGNGWQKYGILKYKSVPESLQSDFMASGYMANGGKGASMRWEKGTTPQDSTDICRVFFLSESGCTLELALEDGNSRIFKVKGAPSMRQIVVGTGSETLSLSVLSGSLVCYGASFESSRGVHVDNFSVRSNNGGAIFRSNASLNRQFSQMMGYDAVVLQYGLNIMLPDKNNYAKYQKQLEDMIRYAKASFPDCEVVVMGVSDRGIKREDSTFTSINSAPALSRHQKAAADKESVLFWDTYGAMQSLGGLDVFAEKGWVASDRVHFTFSGGKALSGKMFPFWKERVAEHIRRSRHEAEIEPVPSDSVMAAHAETAVQNGLAATKSIPEKEQKFRRRR